MAETVVKWVYSGGLNNKNPNESLGGGVSVFEIATEPMNNLLDDVQPEEADEGQTVYRCFYIMNRRHDGSLNNAVLKLEVDEECGTITFGAKQQNDKQILNFVGKPIDGGYIILKTEFGPPFTVNMPFDGGIPPAPDWDTFGDDIQAAIQTTQEFSSAVTVIKTDQHPDPPDGAVYAVEFQGELMNKNMKLIHLVQNSLVKQRGPEYRTIASGASWNRTGDTAIRVFPDIDEASVPTVGFLWFFNPKTGLFVRIGYESYSGNEFQLAESLPDVGNAILGEGLGINDEVWVELPAIEGVTLEIKKDKDGFPVGQYAQMIPRETDLPTDWEEVSSELQLGVVRPQEGFFVWVKRVVDAGTKGCTGKFTMTLEADVVNWNNTP